MATRGARDAIDRRLAVTLDLRDEGTAASLAAGVFESLPGVLRAAALALLHRRCGLTYPPSAAAARELGRRLAGRVAACDAGGGWRWLRRQGRLRLERPGNKPASFAYTLRVPGEVQVPEVGAVLSLRRGEPSGAASAAVMHRERIILPADPEVMLVRNRRPGDRIRPIGRQNRKRLKEVLIDQRIPRHQRDALPLLVLGGDVVWVPGVAIADGLQAGNRAAVWTAELSSIVEVDPS
jgi:tRNA(Ile)-lysidine synthetase-like protein